MRIPTAVVLGLFLFPCASVSAAEWGHLKLRFVYDGEAPSAKTLKAASGPVAGESLLVNKQDQGIQNVCVWPLGTGDDRPAVHPSYEKSAHDKIMMTIDADTIAPRIAIVRTTQSLVFRNADPHAYN